MSIVFTPDSKRLLSSDGGNAIHLWEVNPPREIPRSEKQLVAFKKMRWYSPYISLDPAGKTVFVWFPFKEEDATTTSVEAFDIENGKPLFTFHEGGGRKVRSMAFCAIGKLAATGAKDGSVRLWTMNAADAAVAPGGDWFLFDKKASIGDLALSPDGTKLIATSNDGEIKIAKIEGRTVLKTIKGHTGGVQACIISPDGKRLATYGADNVIKAWDVETGQELRRWDLGKHGATVVNLAFTPDGKQLVTANENTTVYVLELP